MPIVQAKCTNCGGILPVEDTKDAIICPYCQSAFIVEKAINNFQITNNISANVVNVYGSVQSDFEVRGGIIEKYTGSSTVVIIPDGIKAIGKSAFENCEQITSVTIPDSVTSIGIGAFARCLNLEQINLPEGLTRIGENAFTCCTKIREVKIPSKITEIEPHTFAICDNLESVELPNNLVHIGTNAFGSCKNLKRIIIPNTVTNIDELAFSLCSSLTSIVIPDSVTSIGKFAFLSCENLRYVTIKGNPYVDANAFSETPYNSSGRTSTSSYTSTSTGTGGCYVATCVYGSYDCPQVWVLRRYRDFNLDKTWYGRAFIRLYYFISPKLVKLCGGKTWFKAFWKKHLDKMVSNLMNKGYDDTKYIDKY